MITSKRRLQATVATLSFLATTPGAWAQSQAQPENSQAEGNEPPAGSARQIDTTSAQDIIVTATRTARAGYFAPTPTKELTTEQLEARGTSNIGEFLAEVPSFRPSQSAQTNPQQAQAAGQNYADLRGLGSLRTLTLVDGHRFVPSSSTGQVDLNLIPTILIKRVDVVTGGASAAWGSDAVSGVVNILLDDDLNGLKTDASFGITTHGDGEEKRISAAFGTDFADGRGHFMLGGEYVDSDGVDSFADRDWGRLQGELVSYIGARPADAPSRFYARGVQSIVYAYGGVILGANADTNPANGADVLRGIQFGPGGSIESFPYGQVVGTSSINFSGGNPGLYARAGHQLILPVSRRVAMGRFKYDLSDSITMFAEGTYGRSVAAFHAPPTRDTTATSVVIRRENPFLPSQIAAIMDANGITSFGLGRQNDDFGLVKAHNQNTTERFVAGLQGGLGGSWKWDAYYQFGRNEFQSVIDNLRIEQNYRYAIDAIRDGSGNAICRDATARAQGCVPINLFGVGSPSQAAINYVNGTLFQSVVTKQEVAAATLRGDPFSTWAGPVSIAVGAEYRKESAKSKVDPISEVSGFNYANPKAFDGSYNVKEAFLEAVVPLARDLPFAHSIDLNGAVRVTDYSTSGSVTTWKIGATWEPFAGLRLRAARSRDIRAPNNSELFAVNSTRASLVNPFTGTTDQFTVVQEASPSLKPEKAKTWTFGGVFQPSYIPGLSLSVDYYDIKIDGAISGIGAQTLLDNCFSEVQAGAAGFYCGFVDRNGTTITAVNQRLLNLATLKTNGVDFEASYRFGLGGGQLTTSLSGNYTAHLISDDGLGTPRTFNAAGVITNVGSIVDRAGQLGGFGSGSLINATSVPHWTLNGTLSYAFERLTANVQGRFIDGGKIDKTLVGPGDEDYDPRSPISIGDNTIASRFYVNLSLSYDVIKDGTRRVQIYGVVNNLFDKDPAFPAVAVTGLHDRLGRFMKIGVRSNF